MKDEEIQKALTFTKSQVWDAAIFIIDQALQQEVDNAISQSTDETKRVHQCGRAEGVKYVKELLVDTRVECQRRSGVIIPENS